MERIEKLKALAQKKMQGDPAHDFEHIMRVYNNAKKIAKKEGADKELVLAAALLHDIVSFPKSDRRARTASLKSAQVSKKILKEHRFSPDEIEIICDAIRDHSYSRKKVPKTLVGKVLQDADRLDALGAIGIARTFVVGGSECRQVYSAEDPFCKNRMPDDMRWTVDHFYRKLLLLEESMNTKAAKSEARSRTRFMKHFLAQLKREI